MTTLSSFTPTSLAAPLHSLKFLVRKKHRQKGLWTQSIVGAYLLWCLGMPSAICHSCESAWSDLFLWTRHLVQENFWDFPWAFHRRVLYFSCEHLHTLAPVFPLGKKLASLLCLYCKLIHSVYLWAACGWFNICSSPLSVLPVHLQKRWHIANSRGGNLCLDGTDDQCCAHNPMPTTFCQYCVSRFKYIVFLGT